MYARQILKQGLHLEKNQGKFHNDDYPDSGWHSNDDVWSKEADSTSHGLLIFNAAQLGVGRVQVLGSKKAQKT